MDEKNQHVLIATAWGHQGSTEHLANMGRGLYNRYCLGDDFSASAKDFVAMANLCEELKSFKHEGKKGKDFFSTTTQTPKSRIFSPK